MMIRVEQGKGRKDRYVMLSPTLLAVLRQYWKAFRPVRWLFEGKTKGEPLSPSTAEKVFKLAAGRAGIQKNVSFHSMRHAFATHLLEGGTNIRVIQALLGHRSLTTTQVYTHVARTYVNNTVSPLDCRWRTANGPLSRRGVGQLSGFALDRPRRSSPGRRPGGGHFYRSSVSRKRSSSL
jgi:site-specific recombinase XerD